MRQAARQRLIDFREEYTLCDKNWLVKNSVDGVIGYLEQPQLDNWRENLEDFVKMTEIWDKQRNINFSVVDDQLYQDIKRLIE
jgi:Cys-tRNA synthase (O-phospho-L-seryl-tRNA:Cys-tRNA synthase)